MAGQMIQFGPGDYAGVAYGVALPSFGFYQECIFARIYVASGTPSKTVMDAIGMYGSGGDPLDHNYAIPATTAGPNVSWWWVGLINGKPRIWMRDGRCILNAFSQPRNQFPTGMNGAPNYQFILDAPSALGVGWSDVCWQWYWTSANLNGQPSSCDISVNGSQVASFNFPDFLGSSGFDSVVDNSQKSWTVGGTRDTGGVIPDTGTIGLAELFVVHDNSGTPSPVSQANIITYWEACPGPGTPAPTAGYPMDGAADLDDSVGTKDLTEIGGSLTDTPNRLCAGEEIAAPQDYSTPCCEGGSPPGTSAGGVPPGGDPTRPLSFVDPECVGGGLVPLGTAAPGGDDDWDDWGIS